MQALMECYEELKGFLTRKFGCPQLAEDVAQETWVRVQCLSPMPEVRRPRVYLYKIASNLAIDNLRAEKVRSRHVDKGAVIPEEIHCASPLPEQVTDSQMRLAILREAVDELPLRCREVFLMHKFEGLSHADIAERLGISKNMVEKHIIKGLAHCRDRLHMAVQ